MMFPVDAVHLRWWHAATALVLIPAVVWAIVRLLRGEKPVEGGGPWRATAGTLLLFAGAALLGYSRYLEAHNVPDMRIGEVRILGDSRTFHQVAALPDTSRLRLQKSGELTEDVRIRIRGELDARQVERDERGRPLMDADGNWRFQVYRFPLVSDTITIPAEEPIGFEVTVPQPFSRITGIEWLSGPDERRIAVFRISNHIGSFVRPGRAQSPVTVLGRITSDPRVYDFKTVLMVTPAFIQFPAGGPFFRVEGGDIQVTIQPNIDGYDRLARTEAYGADIVAEGELTVARAGANPGGFNARQFMQNYNVYGLMNLHQPRDMDDPPIRLIGPDGGSPRTGHPLVAFSLDLRDRVLRLFKASMPFPQSAFLGGVTLGLRYGLQGAQYPGDREQPEWLNRLGLGRSESTIVDDFRASGVNHVLAVSGLHVTILTAMFIAIFSLLRLPRQFFVPLVIMALIVFAIITGARPSTLRAVIMNSLFLLTWAYLNKGLLSSVMIGVPVAAFMILLHNPLVVVDPSFTLSFGAILSLALITMPVHDVLCRLRGNTFLAVIMLVVATTLIGIHHWALVVTPAFWVFWITLSVSLLVAASALQGRGWGVPRSFAFSALPEPVSTFLAAQVAIQIGMMIPLSAYYFSRWPFGGAYANLIAIPLIGVVVQLGAIAGLLGLIPGIGPFITLLLNAANWLFTTFFLWLAHVSTLIFPYPVVRRPRVIEVFVYYVLLAALVWRKPLGGWIVRRCEAWGWKHPRAPALFAGALGLLAVSPLVFAPPRDTRPAGLHATILSVGYGSSIFIESPGGKKILIDSGFVEHERGRRNEADRTILPFLSDQGVRSLDALILTSPLPERAAGAAYLLEQLRVDRLVIPSSLAGLVSTWTFEEFVEKITGGQGMVDMPLERFRRMYEECVAHSVWPQRPSLAKALASRGDTPVNRWSRWVVDVVVPERATALFEEWTGGKLFRIEVLPPGREPPGVFPVENRGLALRVVYGDFALLIPGSLQYEGQRQLVEKGFPLRSQVLVAPHQGAALPELIDRPDRADVEWALNRYTRSLLEAANPEVVVMEFGSPRPVLGDFGRAAVSVHEITRRFYAERVGETSLYSTDRDLAVMVYSDGDAFHIDTQARRHRARGGEEDAVSDLSIGF